MLDILTDWAVGKQRRIERLFDKVNEYHILVYPEIRKTEKSFRVMLEKLVNVEIRDERRRKKKKWLGIAIPWFSLRSGNQTDPRRRKFRLINDFAAPPPPGGGGSLEYHHRYYVGDID